MKTWHDWKQFNNNQDAAIHPSGRDPGEYDSHGLMAVNDLIQLIPDIQHKKTLDYGCGNGRMLRHMTRWPVYGVDVVPEFIEEAQKYNDKAFLREHLLDTNFEIVYSITVFIHLDDEQTKEALEYIHERLLPRGLAYLQVPLYDHTTSPRDFVDVRTWNVNDFLNLIERVGFEVEELWLNQGRFSYDQIGENHDKLQKLIKI